VEDDGELLSAHRSWSAGLLRNQQATRYAIDSADGTHRRIGKIDDDG